VPGVTPTHTCSTGNAKAHLRCSGEKKCGRPCTSRGVSGSSSSAAGVRSIAASGCPRLDISKTRASAGASARPRHCTRRLRACQPLALGLVRATHRADPPVPALKGLAPTALGVATARGLRRCNGVRNAGAGAVGIAAHLAAAHTHTVPGLAPTATARVSNAVAAAQGARRCNGEPGTRGVSYGL
jgi:hypothetical protein